MDIDDVESTRPWRCVQITVTRSEQLGYLDGLEGAVTVPPGARVECTAFNQTAILELQKVVENGGALPSAWTLTATPVNPPSGVGPQSVQGSAAFQSREVRPGVTYELSETGPTNYSRAVSCAILPDGPQPTAQITLQGLSVGQCTFTNTGDPGLLTLRKVVENGPAGDGPEDWVLTARRIGGGGTVSGPGNSPQVTDQPVPAGTYELSEQGGPAGYDSVGYACNNTPTPVTQITVEAGASVTCTVTNRARPARLTLKKRVLNDGGGTRGPADWNLAAAGPRPLSGQTGIPPVTKVEVPPGRYRLNESGPQDYAASAWSCQNGPDAPPVMTPADIDVPAGGDVRCVITNTYLAPGQTGVLTLEKRVVSDGGGTAPPTAWICPLKAQGPSSVAAAPRRSPCAGTARQLPIVRRRRPGRLCGVGLELSGRDRHPRTHTGRDRGPGRRSSDLHRDERV